MVCILCRAMKLLNLLFNFKLYKSLHVGLRIIGTYTLFKSSFNIRHHNNFAHAADQKIPSLQNFVYDFRWLIQENVLLPDETIVVSNEAERLEAEKKKELKDDLTSLLSMNPTDPIFFNESPKLAKKCV